MGLSIGPELIRRTFVPAHIMIFESRVYQDALQGNAPSGPDDTARLERVLREMNELLDSQRRRRNSFRLSAIGRVVSPMHQTRFRFE